MIETSITKWIKKKIQRLIAIVEDGDTATHSIASGKYVVWKGDLCKASTAIAIGTTLSTSNLTAVSDGGLNEINGNLATETISSGLTALTVARFGKLMIANAQGILPANFQNGIVWNVPVAYRPANTYRSVARDSASGATARLVVDAITGNLSILGNTVNDYFYGQICWIIGA